MLVGKEEGGRKSEVSFLVAIIHVKVKAPKTRLLTYFWSYNGHTFL